MMCTLYLTTEIKEHQTKVNPANNIQLVL